MTNIDVSVNQQGAGLDTYTARTKLKWFNEPKGFGFVIPESDETTDAFLHITKLQDVGVHQIGEGAVLECLISRSEKGDQVLEVLEVIDAGKLDDTQSIPKDIVDIGDTIKMEGTVKWYKGDKGFGFIIPDDGGKDVFIHQSCLEKHGVHTLTQGQRLEMVFRVVPKGRKIVSFTLVEQNS